MRPASCLKVRFHMARTVRLTTISIALALALVALPRLSASPAAQAERSAIRVTAPAGPDCTPQALDRSAALAGGSITVSPMPGSRDASRVTQISLLGAPASEIRRIRVAGSRSGAHPGRLLAYSQGDGASFLSNTPFAEGERVTVRAVLHRGSSTTPFAWSFTVARADTASRSLETPPPLPPPQPGDHQSFVSEPYLRPPAVTITLDSGRQAPGEVLLTPNAGRGQWGPMILDSSGRLQWFKPLPRGARAADLRVQEYDGRPVLTWWQDPLVEGGRRDAGIVIDDSAYRQIAIVRAGNGYKPDLHAFQILPNGAALLTIFNALRCNLSAYGGPADGGLADTLLQEIDLRTGLVRFEWHSLDHVPISDSYMPVGRRGGSLRWPWDWFHINAVSPQPEGRMLVNSRNTWAAYEVDDRSGQVLWRLGGKRSSFALGPGTGTAWEHDVRWQAGGTITFFDNGATPKVHDQSRGLVLRLDLHHMRASFVQSFVHRPTIVSASQGDLQPLTGGDWFVGWGQQPYFSEFAPNGADVFDGHLPYGFQSYTALKASWLAQPSERPKVAVRAGSRGGLAVYASWNGATDVASWRVLGGPSPGELAPLASASWSGLETQMAVPGSPAYVAVQALNLAGDVLATSATVKR
jgi:hypothetical protein